MSYLPVVNKNERKGKEQNYGNTLPAHFPCRMFIKMDGCSNEMPSRPL